jgi:uncharacterized membrane protein YdbT with pleckstrin-like domain
MFLMCGVLYAGYYFEIYQTMRQYVPGTNVLNFTSNKVDLDAAVQYRGGLFGILGSMNIGFKLGAFFAFVIGLLAFLQKMIIMATTEICLTSDRLALKTGWITRTTEEISVDRIEGVDVSQGVLGRMLDFGFVSVRGMGVGEIALPQIAEPIDFRRSIERARSVKKGDI